MSLLGEVERGAFGLAAATTSGACVGSGGDRAGSCAQLVCDLAAVEGEMPSTELVNRWDPDGLGHPHGLARADRCDHIHWWIEA